MTVLVVDSDGDAVPVKYVDAFLDLQDVTVESITGADGLDGAGVLHGAGNPTSGDGVTDDFWINTTAWTIFGPKVGGSWGSGTSLVGPGGTVADGSITLAKLAAALKPSGSAAAGDEAVRALGTAAGTAAAGNDSRITNAVDKQTFDAKGDLLVASGDNAYGKFSAGANGLFLQYDSTQTLGVKAAAMQLSILHDTIATSEARGTNSYAALTTAGPTVVLAANTKYLVEFGAYIDGISSWEGLMSFDRGGTGAVDPDAIHAKGNATATGGSSSSRHVIVDNSASGSTLTLTAKYKAVVGTVNFANRFITATPIT